MSTPLPVRGACLAVILCGCPGLPSGNSSHFDATAAAPVGTQPVTGGSSDGPHPSATVSVSDEPSPDSDPLRDPRERRLRHVRQLTQGLLAASPRFSADGTALFFLERRADAVRLRRLRLPTAASGKGMGGPEGAETAELNDLTPRRGGSEHESAWMLTDGQSDPCVALAPADCPLAPWPEPLGLLACGAIVSAPVSALAACPQLPPGELPCAIGPHALRACPVVADGGARIWVSGAPNEAAPRAIGASDGVALMPALSRDGQRLAFVATPTEGPSRLVAVSVGHPEAEPLLVGPEAQRTLDPTFTANGDRVLFASTADDSAGEELDLQAASVLGGPLERVTFTPGADRFPTFSPDGHWLAWTSARHSAPGGADLFIAEWVENRL